MRLFALLSLCFIALSACQPSLPPASDETQNYNQQGVTFTYPADWRINKDDSNSEGRRIEISSRRTDFLVIDMPAQSNSPTAVTDYADAKDKQADAQLPIGSTEFLEQQTLSFQDGPQDLQGISRTLSFQILGFEVDRLQREYYRRLIDGKAVYFTAENREETFEASRERYRALVRSFAINTE